MAEENRTPARLQSMQAGRVKLLENFAVDDSVNSLDSGLIAFLTQLRTEIGFRIYF
jgi:hypothetical protein